MDSTSLYTFLTVAQLGSFTDAAEKLFVSQSAVSKRVAALENELNSRLLDRIGKQVLLTEAGKVLAARARILLTEIEDTRREIQNLSHGIEGRVSVGTSHHIGLHRLPKVLQNFTTQFPKVELDLQFMNSEQVCDAVKNGELELGVITLPLQSIEHLSLHPIWNDALEFVIGRTHPLFKLKQTDLLAHNKVQCSLENLAEYDAILPSRGTYTREIVDQVFFQRKLPLRTKMQTNYLETIKMLVSVGLGWSVLPRKMLADDEVLTVRVPKVQISRNLGAVWHSSRTLSNAAKQLLKQLEQHGDHATN
ncbi:LysR family transcriptional regulator [Kaarinaea lacus]